MQEIVYLEPSNDELSQHFKLSFVFFGVTIVVTSTFVFLQLIGYQAIPSLILGYLVGLANMKLLVVTMTAVLDHYQQNNKKRIYLSTSIRYFLYFIVLVVAYLNVHLSLIWTVIGIMMIKVSLYLGEILHRG